jgi:hypothetical protein
MSTAQRNGNGSQVNDKRNGPMTNAERQRRYRDRSRGCPPVGRWAYHTATAKIAAEYKISRTMIFMSAWIKNHAPEYCDALVAGSGTVSKIYREQKPKFDAGLFRAISKDPKDGSRLTWHRVDGEFFFKWIKK